MISLTGDRPLPYREAVKLKRWWDFWSATMVRAPNCLGKRRYHVYVEGWKFNR